MNRRGFLRGLGAIAAGLALDPERILLPAELARPTQQNLDDWRFAVDLAKGTDCTSLVTFYGFDSTMILRSARIMSTGPGLCYTTIEID